MTQMTDTALLTHIPSPLAAHTEAERAANRTLRAKRRAMLQNLLHRLQNRIAARRRATR